MKLDSAWQSLPGKLTRLLTSFRQPTPEISYPESPIVQRVRPMPEGARRFQLEDNNLYGSLASGMAPHVTEKMYSEESCFRAYNMSACAHPDAVVPITSAYGRLPLPMEHVKLHATRTFTIPSGSTGTMSFAAFYRKYAGTPTSADYTTLVAMAHLTGTTNASGMDSATPTLTYYPAISDLIPTSPISGSDYPVLLMTGSYKITVVKGALTDEDPVVHCLNTTTLRCSPQWDTGLNSQTSDQMHVDYPKFQTPFTGYDSNVHANIPSGLQKDKGCFVYGTLAPYITESGKQIPQIPLDIGATPVMSNFTRTQSAADWVNQPQVQIINASANTMTVTVEIMRNVFAVPSEQSILANPNRVLREARFQFPYECFLLGATAAVAANHDLAHERALAITAQHPAARPIHKVLDNLPVNQLTEVRGVQSKPVKPAEGGFSKVLSGIADAIGIGKNIWDIGKTALPIIEDVFEFLPLLA